MDDALTLTLEGVCARLRSLRQSGFSYLEEALYNYHALIQLQSMARELDCAHPLKLSFASLGAEEEAIREQVGAIFAQMGQAFPLNDFWLEAILDDEEMVPPFVPIHLCNLARSWDEFGEMVEDPETIASDWASVAFAFWLDHDLIDECWESAAEHFGWPIRRLPKSMRARTGYHWRVDCEKLLASLDEACLAEFEAPFKMSWFDTGSPFLDLDEQLLENGNAPAFDLENVRKLPEQWALAQQTIAQAEAASALAAANPGIYTTRVKLYRAALTEVRY